LSGTNLVKRTFNEIAKRIFFFESETSFEREKK